MLASIPIRSIAVTAQRYWQLRVPAHRWNSIWTEFYRKCVVKLRGIYNIILRSNYSFLRKRAQGSLISSCVSIEFAMFLPGNICWAGKLSMCFHFLFRSSWEFISIIFNSKKQNQRTKQYTDSRALPRKYIYILILIIFIYKFSIQHICAIIRIRQNEFQHGN